MDSPENQATIGQSLTMARDAPELESVEAAIGKHEHVWCQLPWQQSTRHDSFALFVGTDVGGHHGLGSALDQTQQPSLWKGAVSACGTRVAKIFGVGRSSATSTPLPSRAIMRSLRYQAPGAPGCTSGHNTRSAS
jgi:hypothetical protein